MKKIYLLKTMLIALFAAVSISAGAQSVAVWDTPNNTNPDNPEENIWLTELAPNIALSDANVTISAMVRGGGFTDSGTVAGNSFGGNANQTTLEAAIADGDFYTMTIVAKPGYKMSLTGIPEWRTRAAAVNTTTGDGNDVFIYVQYALNGGEFKDAGVSEVTSTSANNNAVIDDFSEQAKTDLANLTSTTTVTFRFVVVTDVEKNVYIMTAGTSTKPNAFVLGGTVLENIATIAQWDGYSESPTDNVFAALGGNSVNINNATLTREEGFAGTYNVGTSTFAGRAQSNRWNGDATENYWIATFNTIGYDNLSVTSQQRSTGTGPADFLLQYYDVTTEAWVDVVGGNVVVADSEAATSGLLTVPLPAVLANKETVSLRWLRTSMISAGGGTVTSGTSNIEITVSGKESLLPVLTSLTAKWWDAKINGNVITVDINSQEEGFGSLDYVEFYATATGEGTTVTVNGTALDLNLLPPATGNGINLAALGLVPDNEIKILVAVTNAAGTTDYTLTVTDDSTLTDVEEVRIPVEVVGCYSIMGVAIDCDAAQGIVIKRYSNGDVKKEFVK